MALTITVVKQNVVGAQKEAIVDVIFDSSYPTGGEAFTPRDIHEGESSTSTFHFVSPQGNPDEGGTYIDSDARAYFYDYANEKLMLYTALGTQAAGASDQADVRIRCLCRWGAASG